MKKLLVLVLLSFSLNIVAGPTIIVGPQKTKWQKLKETVTSRGAKKAYKVVGALVVLYVGVQFYMIHSENKERATIIYEKLKDKKSILSHFFDHGSYSNLEYRENENGYEHSYILPQDSYYYAKELASLAQAIDTYNDHQQYVLGGDFIKSKTYRKQARDSKIYKVSFSLPH